MSFDIKDILEGLGPINTFPRVQAIYFDKPAPEGPRHFFWAKKKIFFHF